MDGAGERPVDLAGQSDAGLRCDRAAGEHVGLDLDPGFAALVAEELVVLPELRGDRALEGHVGADAGGGRFGHAHGSTAGARARELGGGWSGE
jgi:hypothetical protein